MRNQGLLLPLLAHEHTGMGIKHRKGPWHRNDNPGSPLPSPIPNQPLVMGMPLLVSSPPGPTDPWLYNGRGLASPHPSQPLISGVPPTQLYCPAGTKALQGFPWVPSNLTSARYHCPHSHVSPSEGASLGLGGSCRCVHGGWVVQRASPLEHLIFGMWLLQIWSHTALDPHGRQRLLCLTHSGEGGLAPAEELRHQKWLLSPPFCQGQRRWQHLMHCRKGDPTAKANKETLDYSFLPLVCTWILCITGQVI